MANEHRIWTDGVDCYVATSADEAMTMQRELIGENPCDAGGWGEDPREFISIIDDDGGPAVRRTREEWCKENGPGFLCSSEY